MPARIQSLPAQIQSIPAQIQTFTAQVQLLPAQSQLYRPNSSHNYLKITILFVHAQFNKLGAGTYGHPYLIILHFLGKKIGAGEPYLNGAVLGSATRRHC